VEVEKGKLRRSSGWKLQEPWPKAHVRRGYSGLLYRKGEKDVFQEERAKRRCGGTYRKISEDRAVIAELLLILESAGDSGKNCSSFSTVSREGTHRK